jgi:hypothetical protein
LTDGQVTLAMGAIAVAPSNHQRVYAGTGEANNAGDSNHGQGILVSSDGGSTWTLATAGGAFTRNVVAQIAVDPTNADVAYAAVGGYNQNGQQNANTGIWQTTDGGVTWTNLTLAAGLSSDISWSSVVVDPNTPSIIYAAMGDPFGSIANVYRFDGATWMNLASRLEEESSLASRRRQRLRGATCSTLRFPQRPTMGSSISGVPTTLMGQTPHLPT